MFWQTFGYYTLFDKYRVPMKAQKLSNFYLDFDNATDRSSLHCRLATSLDTLRSAVLKNDKMYGCNDRITKARN